MDTHPREGIRQWYERTTRSWRKALVWATAIAIVGAIIFYCLGSMGLFTRVQTFNGAMTIPIGAGLWMAAFVFIFLIPSREAGFRSQEWIEYAVAIVEKSVKDEISPAIKLWMRIGERVEKEIPEIIDTFKQGLKTVQESAVKIEDAVKKSDKVAQDVKPVVEALRKLQERIDQEIKNGIIEEVRKAAKAVQGLAGPGAAENAPISDQPSADRALKFLRSRK